MGYPEVEGSIGPEPLVADLQEKVLQLVSEEGGQGQQHPVHILQPQVQYMPRYFPYWKIFPEINYTYYLIMSSYLVFRLISKTHLDCKEDRYRYVKHAK